VEWGVNTACAITRATDDSVQSHNDLVNAIVAYAGHTCRRIIFANGGNYSPVRTRDLYRIRIGVGSRGVLIG